MAFVIQGDILKNKLICILLILISLIINIPFYANAKSCSDFIDCNDNSWYKNAVNYCVNYDYMSGTSKNTFSPNQNLTRAMIVQILYKVSEDNGNYSSYDFFRDVSHSSWYYNSVQWAYTNGIVSGTGNDKFSPNAVLTRQDFAVILYKYAKYKNLDTSCSISLLNYVDYNQISSYAVNALSWCVSHKFISGTSTTKLSPKKSTTRAQCAQIIYKFCDYSTEKEIITINGIPLEKMKIYLSPYEDSCVQNAANELAEYISKSFDCDKLQIVKSYSFPDERGNIIIGNILNNHNTKNDAKESYTIESKNENLLIYGGDSRGILYGVYGFLEDYIGWAFLTKDCEVLNLSSKELGDFKEYWSPTFEWRDICSSVYWSEEISVKRRLNSNYQRYIGDDFGGSCEFTGKFVHSFQSLLGVSQSEQPCLCDEENIYKCAENIKKLLKYYPDTEYISVSQNDNNEYCKCSLCQACDNEEGSHAGTIIRFVNEVASLLKDDYPNLKITTLAYLYSETPTKTAPADNVIVMYAPLNRCYGHGIENSCNNTYYNNLNGWLDLSDNIYVWDYTSNFDYSLATLPDFTSVLSDIRYYAENGVKGLFFEGDNCSIYERSCDFSEYRSYIISRLMSNPYMSEDDIEKYSIVFFKGYYGPGGEYLYNYIQNISGIVRVSSMGKYLASCYQNPYYYFSYTTFNSFLSQFYSYFDSAYSLCETETQKLRVDRARMSLEYYDLLYNFAYNYNKGNEYKEKYMVLNKSYYERLCKYYIQPTYGATIPEITNFNINVLNQIYA